MTNFEEDLLRQIVKILANLGWRGEVEIMDGSLVVPYKIYDHRHCPSTRTSSEDWSTDGSLEVMEQTETSEPRGEFGGGSEGRYCIVGATWAILVYSRRTLGGGMRRSVSRVLVSPAGLRDPAKLIAEVADYSGIDLAFRAARYDRAAAVKWLREKFTKVRRFGPDHLGDEGWEFFSRLGWWSSRVVTSTTRGQEYVAPDQDISLELFMRHGWSLLEEAFPEVQEPAL